MTQGPDDRAADDLGLRPLAPPEWPPEMRDALARLAPPEGSVYAQRRQQRGGSGGANVLGLMAHHPELAEAYFGFNRHLLYSNELGDRARELVVLRVSWQLRSPYEWGQHVPVALDCDLTEDEIGRITEGPTAAGWSTSDRLLLEVTDALLADGDLDDGLRRRLADALGPRAVLDLVFTVGGYATLAMAFNAARLPLDPDISGFPDGGG